MAVKVPLELLYVDDLVLAINVAVLRGDYKVYLAINVKGVWLVILGSQKCCGRHALV